MNSTKSTDVLVIGSGAAGLSVALHLADQAQVLVLSKEDLRGGSTNRAQGGVAAVTLGEDSLDSHVADTIRAGAGLCDPAVVRFAVERADAAIRGLTKLGVEFDRDGDALHLTREGGHSHRRVLHVADATGQAIATTLATHASNHPNIEISTNRVALDIICGRKFAPHSDAVVGAYVYNPGTGHVEAIQARYVVLATGGASKVYRYTSNPDGSTGDGIAMAWRVGCRVANMEFNQFHPTCLYSPQARSFLISEAIRGEGAWLVLDNGERFMHKFDERGELASRDVVARAIDFEMKRLGAECVYLDATHLGDELLESRFPTILSTCQRVGIDIRKERIPVVPAAHYTCGGVVVDQFGCSDVPGLYVVGEAAYTGLHGANRLASNSLLECFVFAQAAANHILSDLGTGRKPLVAFPDWDESLVSDSDEEVVLVHNWAELRRFMWDYVGIVRTDRRLERAARRIQLLKREVHDYYSNYRVNADLIELRNLIHIADLIVRSARSRKESRGLHCNLNYPETNPSASPTVLRPELDVGEKLPPVAMSAERT